MRISCPINVRIVVWRSVFSGGPDPSPLERRARECESLVVLGPCRTTRHCRRVKLFGNAPQSGGEFCPRLNIGERSIANKYHKGKMKMTLKRESESSWNCWEGSGWGRRCFSLECGTVYVGPPISSGYRSTRIVMVAQTRIIEMLAETSSSRLWTVARLFGIPQYLRTPGVGRWAPHLIRLITQTKDCGMCASQRKRKL